MKKCVVLVSGGMDSTVILYSVFNSKKFDEIHCLSFDYRQRHSHELDCIKWNIEELNNRNQTKLFHKIIDINFLKTIAPTSCLTNNDIEVPDGSTAEEHKLPTSYVPNRNMILISIAASYAEAIGASVVYHGAVAADLDGGYWDCRPEFFENLNKTFDVNFEHKITIEAPLLYMSKKDIILKGLENGVKFEHTWTDYTGGKDKGRWDETINGDYCKWLPNWVADANSASSKCRIQGFIEAGYIDPLPYEQDLTQLWKDNNCKEIK